jgi:hypothetical protein
LYILCFSFSSDVQETFVGIQFASSIIQKSLNLVKEWEKYWKLLDDINKCLMMSGSTLVSRHGIKDFEKK